MHEAVKGCSPGRDNPCLRRQLADWATAATIRPVHNLLDLLGIGTRRDQRMVFTQNLSVF